MGIWGWFKSRRAMAAEITGLNRDTRRLFDKLQLADYDHEKATREFKEYRDARREEIAGLLKARDEFHVRVVKAEDRVCTADEDAAVATEVIDKLNQEIGRQHATIIALTAELTASRNRVSTCWIKWRATEIRLATLELTGLLPPVKKAPARRPQKLKKAKR